MKKFNLNEKNKTVVLTIIGIITVLIFLGGASYAYFKVQGGNTTQADINVTTATTDNLILTIGDGMVITADQENFGKGKGNREGEIFARAELRANSDTNKAKANYYVYLDIEENNFIYTTEAKTAELILKVVDPEGNEVKAIEGLNYVTVNGESGFDVTDKKGLITLVNNKEIVSNGIKVENWDIKLTLVNLDSDQSKNAGNILKAKLIITKEEKIELKNVNLTIKYDDEVSSDKIIQGKYNTTIKLEGPTRIGYKFTGWSVVDGDSTIKNNNEILLGSKDTIIKANWEKLMKVTLIFNGATYNGVNDKYEIYVNLGDKLDLDAPTKAGFNFNGWFLTSEFNEGTSWNLDDPITEDMTLYAQFIIVLPQPVNP